MWSSETSLLRRLPLANTFVSASTDLARWIVLGQLHELKHSQLFVHDVDGSKHAFGPTGALNVELHINASSAWTRLLLAHDIGFAEAYMLGELSCSDLTAFFRLFIQNAAHQASRGSLVAAFAAATSGPLHHLANTSTQSILNAQRHYSLGNDVFAAFLDSTMTYSAPIWLPVSDPAAATDDLEAAQHRKLQNALDAVRAKADDHVLEIGTGWGSFAIEAARTIGCRVTTVTASAAQAQLARERIQAAGVDGQVEVLVCDYREIPLPDGGKGRYDKIVSIEMVEHVGAAYLDTYFECIDRCLKLDGGIAMVQGITIPEARAAGYGRRSDFIQRYIFPGGHLPTVSGLVASIDRGSQSRLVVEDITSVSGHYVRALREWRENFLANWDAKIKPALVKSEPSMSDVDMEIFRRKWEYYFCYCEAGFATKTLGDVCVTFGREGTMQLIEDVPV
jgi:cyclopropane-fatty-acyl-phospholipid synthase